MGRVTVDFSAEANQRLEDLAKELNSSKADAIRKRSIAEARDQHYHKPPDYLVVEPEDTSRRTKNLRQTNTNGYK